MKIAVAGAGLIGREHAARIVAHPDLELAYLVDPRMDPADSPFEDVPVVTDLEPVLGEVDGVILATPNALHRDGAVMCIRSGCAVEVA